MEQKLGIRFRDRRLLEQALVHPSFSNETAHDQESVEHYERLEFLGDSVLGACVAWDLFHRHPPLSEGELTRLRSLLVQGPTLATIARRFDLGPHIKLGRGEAATGGCDRDSILAASFEAVIGAIWVDAGFETARRFVTDALGTEAEHLLVAGIPQDPKSKLQELVQQTSKATPQYQLVSAEGPDHAKSFEVEVLMNGQPMGRGRGTRKLDAEKEPALEPLTKLASLDTSTEQGSS
ncbi:MAG: ribonuclease III [Dehalococcoidia bacterium]|nr:ribonuclease III [Dehalococcoidia bacterium]